MLLAVLALKRAKGQFPFGSSTKNTLTRYSILHTSTHCHTDTLHIQHMSNDSERSRRPLAHAPLFLGHLCEKTNTPTQTQKYDSRTHTHTRIWTNFKTAHIHTHSLIQNKL